MVNVNVTSKVQLLGDRIHEDKYLLSFRKDKFFKAIKPQYYVINDIVFARDNFDVRFEFFNIVEPADDTIRSGVVCNNV